jgi:hypothetical protein
MDVYVKGTDKACWHKTWKDNAWGAWENLGGDLKYPPNVVAYDNKMELYITGNDNAMYRKVWQNDKWTSSWEWMGKDMDSKPSPIHWNNGKCDVYGKGTDSTCKRCY